MEHLKILTKIITFLTGFKAVPHRLNLMEHKNEQIPKSRALARSTIDLKSWNKVEQIKNESKQYKNSKKQFFKSEKKEFRSMQFAVIKYWARLVRFAAGIFIDTAKKWTGAVDNLVSANGYFNLVFISAVSRIDKLATTAKGFGRKILFPLGFSVGEYSLYGVCIARDTTKGKSGYFDTEYIFYYSPIHIWIIPNFKELQ